MYTNPHVYAQGETVNAAKLNADGRDNINAVFSLATNAESMLNPVLSGSISYSTNFPIDYIGLSGSGFVVGSVGLERTIDALWSNKREFRVAVSYTMATNSNNGSCVKLLKRRLGRMGRPFDRELGTTEIFSGPTETTSGRYFRVSPWQSMASIWDEVWEIRVFGETLDYPDAGFSDLNICFQIREY